MKSTILILLAIVLTGPPASREGAEKQHMQQEVQDIDKKAEALLNDFMNALLTEDFNQAATAVKPYCHKSLYNKAQTDLSSDILRFSFKKAHSNAHLYEVPVKITQIKQIKTTGIGFKGQGWNTYEKGIERNYWIAKKPGVNGMPAPVTVFFPEDGGEPKVSYMGSL